MGIFDKLFKPQVKQPSVPFLFNYGQAVAPDRDVRGYLNAYGEVGWLFAVVTKIAEGVADANWTLYTKDQKGELKEIQSHPIMNLLNFCNPFQTRQEFFELHQIYMGLVGECFWVINKTKGGIPGEMWIVPPDRMSVVPSKQDFIAGYVYQVGSEKIPLDKELVIHHKLPNPTNPYRGLGPVQALAYDLDSEVYAGKWNRNFFYNSARPDGVLSFEGTLSEEQYTRLKLQWKEKHGGTANAHGMALLEGGGKYTQIQLSAKDMDFKELRILNRDNILGVFGMPLSVMGITENVNRANAEAGDYTFARWIVTPKLNRMKNKLNEQLLPMFPNSDKLILDFDDVVPETIEQKQALASSGISAGYMTINEARQIQGLKPVPNGDVLMMPFNMVPTPVSRSRAAVARVAHNHEAAGSNPASATKFTNEWKETYWKGYVSRAEVYEKKMISALKEMFAAQERDAISKLNNGKRTLLDQAEAKEQYVKLATPLLTDLFESTYQNGLDLIKPKPVHTGKADSPLSAAAIAWLKTRIAWAALELGEVTANLLAQALAAGYEAGESIPDLAKRVRDVFDTCSRTRSILIARTETITASAQGAIEGYKDAGIEKAEFLAALDGRTCEDCDSMNGEVFNLDDTQGVIPIHPDCRCCWIPVI